MSETAYYLRFLRNEYAARKERNPQYSIRAFARSLGMSGGALNQILSGKRVPSYRTLLRLVQGLAVDPSTGRDIVTSVAGVQKKRELKRMSPAFRKWDAAPRPTDLSLDLFRCISDWHHYAILELTFVEGFRSDPQWIADQLGISAAEARHAVDRLLELGLLETRDGQWVKGAGHITTADKHLTTPALRKRQRQILEKAIAALEQVPVEKRSQTAMTMAIDPELLPVAKRMIEEFTHQLCSFLESKARKHVYELSVSLIPLQLTLPEERKTK